MSELTKRQRRKIPELRERGFSDLEIALQLKIDASDVSSMRKTKRRVITGVSASVLAIAIGGGIYFTSSLPVVQQYIHKEIIHERQAILDKLVAEAPGPHIGGISYSHSGQSRLNLNVYGITLSDDSFFGKHQPAYIVLFSNAFEDESREIMGRELVIPGKVKIKIAYKHEWIHARYQFEGIHFDNGMFIDSTNYNSIRPDLKRFLVEAMAQMDTYKFFRDQGQDKTAILFAAGKAGGWFNLEYPKLLVADNFSKYEIQLLEPVVMGYNNLVSEINTLWQQYSTFK